MTSMPTTEQLARRYAEMKDWELACLDSGKLSDNARVILNAELERRNISREQYQKMKLEHWRTQTEQNEKSKSENKRQSKKLLLAVLGFIALCMIGAFVQYYSRTASIVAVGIGAISLVKKLKE